jgi:hypothetical protein
MGKARLTKEQIQVLINSWKNCISGSLERKLIEDLFIITETPAPFQAATPVLALLTSEIIL